MYVRISRYFRPLARRPIAVTGCLIALIALAGGIVWMSRGAQHTLGLSTGLTSDTTELTNGQWRYLPGAAVQADGIHIHYLGQKIVEQDGSGGQPNPPVNLYGTRLDVQNDFSLGTVLRDVHGAASLQLYGQVPIIQDEFRVEPPSLRFTLSGDQLTIRLWKRYGGQPLSAQNPALTKTYTVPSGDDNHTITIAHQGTNIVLGADGAALGSIPDNGIWQSGHIWFGADAEAAGDSWTLASLKAAAGANGRVTAVDAADIGIDAGTATDLQSLASRQRPGFLIGAAMALAPLVSDSSYAAAALHNFGSMTTENALKWQFTEPQPGVYDFHEADALVDIAHKHGLAVHGHTLVFGEANPVWVSALPTTTPADKLRVQQIMTDHIAQTVGHFKGRIATWDVVNEPLADYDSPAGIDGLRLHKWYQAMGPHYIATAFAAARQADPTAKLYINEFGLEQDGDRWDTFLALMRQLKSQGVPIDGVGMQAHVYESGDVIDPDVLRAHIRQLAALGLTTRISEMDVYDDDGTSAQADQYAAVLGACLHESACVSWTTWGVSDRYDMFQGDDRTLQYGHDLLWDDTIQPTPAARKLQQILNTGN